MIALLLVATIAGTAPVADDKPAKVAEKKVCRTIVSTGSRLGDKKVCRSTTEWAEIDAAMDRNKGYKSGFDLQPTR